MLFKQEITGTLCNPGESQEFTNSIVQLLTHDSLRWQMGMEGRKYALSQRWDRIFDQLLMQYDSVINEQRNEQYA